jgi:hypothetical protein
MAIGGCAIIAMGRATMKITTTLIDIMAPRAKILP